MEAKNLDSIVSADSEKLFGCLRFDNSFVRELPGEDEVRPGSRQVFGSCYSRVEPTSVKKPSLVAHASEVAQLVNLDDETLQHPAFAQIFGGNFVLPEMAPFAACYGGHQFGHWAGQLGDGRAMTLGEVINKTGERWELQLKGAGPTPYSRRADGRAVMRSSVREFLCSEAMYHLGVPTTRALSLVATGDAIMRDMFYDGHPEMEPGAIVCRVAPSFLRFGNFQLFASRGEKEVLAKLVAYTFKHHFPEFGEPTPESISQWYAEVCRRTAVMGIHWMRVGFVHGVMNTDNMSILGLTIDYGPYGWLDDYDETWTPNTTDAQGRRYAYGNQLQIAYWNLVQLGNALVPLIGEPAPLQAALDTYGEAITQGYPAMMAQKLGWLASDEEAARGYKPNDADLKLTGELTEILQAEETDMTLFFRHLADIDLRADLSDEVLLAPLEVAYYQKDSVKPENRRRLLSWLRNYQQRSITTHFSIEERRTHMNRINPLYVLRNYLAQEAIELAEKGDASGVATLLQIMRNPYTEQEGQEHYAKKRPEWARHKAGCSMLSCSS